MNNIHKSDKLDSLVIKDFMSKVGSTKSTSDRLQRVLDTADRVVSGSSTAD